MTRIALMQVASPETESQADRIARVEAMLRAQQGVDFFVLPELWSAGYFSFEGYEALAEPLDGPTVQMGRRVALDLNAYVHLGSIVERDEAGKLYNTAVLIGPDGRIAQTYRKIHVFGYKSLEAQMLTPGASLSVVETPLGETASTTCYDLRFPGLWQQLSERGATAVIVPAAWPAARREHWRLLSQARAVEHQVWVLAVNSCATQHGVELGGHSRLVDPSGRILVECGDEEQVAIVDIEPSLVEEIRAKFPVLNDRLKSYTQLSDKSGAEL